MSFMEDFVKQLEVGQPIFDSFFFMKDDELKPYILEKIKEMGLNTQQIEDILTSDTACVTKTIKSDTPYEIEISYYSTIEISPIGIRYKPEHGNQHKVCNLVSIFKRDN